jgi:hypothetical protein
MLITIPGIAITMTAESLLRSFRNAHHDHFGIAITVPRNPHLTEHDGLAQTSDIPTCFTATLRQHLGLKPGKTEQNGSVATLFYQ